MTLVILRFTGSKLEEIDSDCHVAPSGQSVDPTVVPAHFQVQRQAAHQGVVARSVERVCARAAVGVRIRHFGDCSEWAKSKRVSKKIEIGVEVSRHDKGVGRNLGV